MRLTRQTYSTWCVLMLYCGPLSAHTLANIPCLLIKGRNGGLLTLRGPVAQFNDAILPVFQTLRDAKLLPKHIARHELSLNAFLCIWHFRIVYLSVSVLSPAPIHTCSAMRVRTKLKHKTMSTSHIAAILASPRERLQSNEEHLTR